MFILKLIDFRTYNTNKVVASFRHVSEHGFRDIHINSFRPELFAAALNDQCIVPVSMKDKRKTIMTKNLFSFGI